MKDEAKKEEKNNKRKRRSKHASERRFFDRFDRIWFWIWAIAILIVLLAATLGYVDEYLGEPKKVPNIAVYKKRTIVIGDVHGCLSELKELLAKVNYSRIEDRVILVGDIVGKGPHSAETIRFARLMKFESVCGNHDDRLKMDGDADALPASMAATLLSKSDWAWLYDLPYYIEIPDQNIIIVHAGLLPDVPLNKQDPLVMTTIRNIDSNGRPRPDTKKGESWASRWQGPQHIVFGHDAARGLQKHPFATGIDTGCVFGNKLTAFLLPERVLVDVPAYKEYSPIHKMKSDRPVWVEDRPHLHVCDHLVNK